MEKETQGSMTAGAILDYLQYINRAYQVLYTLGETATTVRTLSGSEARCLVGIVQQLATEPITALDEILHSRMSARTLEYIAGLKVAS